MAGYTRQSVADIINGSDITAPPINAEFNQIQSAFNGTTGHSHDGSTGNAPKIDLTTSVSGYLPAVHGGIGGKNNLAATTNPTTTDDAGDGYAPGSLWENTTTGRVFICVGNTNNAAVWRELVTVITDNKIEPITHDTIDLGTPTVRFQDLYLSGGISASGNVAIGGTLNITGATSLSSLTASGTTTLNGDTDIGNANTDTVTITAKIDSDLIPSGIRDLGSTTDQWQNLYIDGTATVDTLTVDESATIAANLTVSGTTNIPTANITGGSIDGTPVGSTTTSSGAFTTLSSSGLATLNSVNIDGGAIDGTTIGASSHTTGKFTTLQSTGLATLNSVNIDGGAIDGTTIGATSTSSGAFTTLSASGGITGNLTGNVVGNVTGNVTGNLTGDVTGDLTGNVTASSGTSTFNNVTINGNLDMDATSTATITNLSTPVNSGDAASKGYVDTSITNLIDGAPDALNTLNELAAALADDANAYTTLDNKINTKLSKAGDTMTGNLSMGSNKVTSSATPSATSDLTNKSYVDTQRDTRLPLSGGTMSGGITMGGNKITATYTPSANSDLTTKTYVDGILGSATAASTSATAAATSATNAATSESNAATSAAAASASETAAGTSETNAASSASSAATSASNAATSESNASTSETNAASSASSASSSATAAANSATAAAASATAAAASESAASTSETNAAASAATAATEATKLTNSESLPDVRPSLLLDFANSKTLDPRITFTRGSTATYWDGKTTTKAEENLLLRSQDFDHSYWEKARIDITANATTAPDGTTTAEAINQASGQTQIGRIFRSNLPNSAGAYTASVYAKANTRNFVTINTNDFINTGFNYTWFNLSTGAVGTNYSGHTASITDVGNGWYRCSITFTSVAAGSAGDVGFGLADTDGSETCADDQNGIYLWGAQLEQRSSATAYTATTSSPIVKYQPVLQTAASGEARFDHDPVTGESKGLLIEEARTNLNSVSATFNTGAYVATNATKYIDRGISPDGTQSAVQVSANYGQTTPQGMVRNITCSANTTYTSSTYVKMAGYRYLTFWIDNGGGIGRHIQIDGTDGSITNTYSNEGSVFDPNSFSQAVDYVGNGWYRISITYKTLTGISTMNHRWYSADTSGSDNFGSGSLSSAASGENGLLVWGVQMELGHGASSYIPTSGSTVTRSTDDASIALTNEVNLQEATVYAEAATYRAYAAETAWCPVWQLNDGVSSANGVYDVRAFQQTFGSMAVVTGVGGSSTLLNDGQTVTNGEFYQYGLFWNQGSVSFYKNGAGVGSTTNKYANPAWDTLDIGWGDRGGRRLDGHIKKLSVYPQALSNNTMIAMTEA